MTTEQRRLSAKRARAFWHRATNGIKPLAIALVVCAASQTELLAQSGELPTANAPSTAATTTVTVNVYKIVTPPLKEMLGVGGIVGEAQLGGAPLWHSGIVFDGQEYFFHSTDRVEVTEPLGMKDTIHHRTISRRVSHSAAAVRVILDECIREANGQRYDLTANNCNCFVDRVLKRLGSEGLDREYLEASGLARVGRQLPGGATIGVVLTGLATGNHGSLEAAAKEDLSRVERLPQDIVAETERVGVRIEAEVVRAGERIEKEWKRAIRKIRF